MLDFLDFLRHGMKTIPLRAKRVGEFIPLRANKSYLTKCLPGNQTQAISMYFLYPSWLLFKFDFLRKFISL